MTKQEQIKQIINENLGLITKLCSYFYKKNPKHLLDLEDYYQEAFSIITEVADQYDSNKGQMSTFLYHAIKNGLTNLANQNNSSLSVTNDAVSLSTNIYKLRTEGTNSIEICQKLNISLNRLYECENIITKNSVPHHHRSTARTQFNDLLTDLNSILSKDEKMLLNYHLSGLSTKEISSLVHKSPAVVRTRIRNLLHKIKAFYHDE
jgi:RNA polymerase sigma factor (sigma-70 family)